LLANDTVVLGDIFTLRMRPFGYRQPFKKEDEKHIINDRIRAFEVRVIGSDGSQLGVMNTRDAIALAESEGFDLVEVAPEAKPPVCKILDYGKLKYKEQKKKGKKTAQTVTKELRLRYNTDSHDLDTKVRNARKFIEDGDKVKFEMRFKGRESIYEELGKDIFKQIIENLSDLAVVEENSPLIGQRMIMVFGPKPAGK
jgi:translation initiation factor IF-3